MSKLIRLLRIINLVQSSPGIKVKELAERCETTERTIYRDLEILTTANIPIVHEGHGKGYKFIGKFKLHPINWNEEEFNVFQLLPLFLNDNYKTSIFYSAYEKVMATHMAEKAERNSLLEGLLEAIQFSNNSEVAENHVFPIIIEAIFASRTIEAHYHTQSRNVTTTRKIAPYFFLPRKNRLYVIGYCYKNNAIRTFRLNRFHNVKILNETFKKNPIDIEKYLQYTWSVIRGEERIHFKIKFSPKIARYIKEEQYNVKPKFTDLPDGGLLFEVIVNDDREFIKWVMQYGPEAEILEPKKYRNKMKEVLQQWSNIYQED